MVYETIGTGVLFLGATVLLLTLLPLFALRLLVRWPFVFAQTKIDIRRAQRILMAGSTSTSELERLIHVMQGLDPHGKPDGFSWVKERKRKSLAPQLVALRAKLSSETEHQSAALKKDRAAPY